MKKKTSKARRSPAAARKRKAAEIATVSVKRLHPLHDTRFLNEIRIGKRHRKDYGDVAALARSIDARGALLQPIVIDEHDTLIAGERRMRAWKLSRFKAQPIPVHVVSIDAIIAGEWDENAERKNFTLSEQVAIKREIENKLKALAKARQRAGTRADPAAKGEAAEQAARVAGKSRRTLEKAEAVLDAAERDPKRFGKMKDEMDRSGRADGPYRRVKNIEQAAAIRAAPPPLPMRGPYEAGVIDPPWPDEPDMAQADIDARGRSTRPYPAMSIQSLCKFMSDEVKPLLADHCAIGLWTTSFHMRHAFQLLHALGIDQHSTIVTWEKDKFSKGQVRRGITEHCIIALKGKPTLTLGNETTLVHGPRRENSRKPDEFYAEFAAVHPAPRYFEIFSRGGRGDNWDCHGDEVGKFAPGETGDARVAKKSAHAAATLTPDGKGGKKRRAKKADRSAAPRCGWMGTGLLLPPWPLDERGNGWPAENGHVVSMTSDAESGEHVGTCQCGRRWQFPRGREVAMDLAVATHWLGAHAEHSAAAESASLSASPAETSPEAGSGVFATAPAAGEDQLDIPGFLDRRGQPAREPSPSG